MVRRIPLFFISGHSDYNEESEKIGKDMLSRLKSLGFGDIYGNPIIDKSEDGGIYENEEVQDGVEFSKLCESFHVVRGSLTLSEPRDQNNNVAMFIYRCYEDILGRIPDDEGLNGWAGQINSKVETPKEIIHGFILSEEFVKRNYTDEEYVKILYSTFLNRGYDVQGLKEWCDVLQRGSSRVEILDGFYNSPEYQALLKFYGL